MAERIMMRIGDFDFEIGTAAYQKLICSQGCRWPEQDRIDRLPALQFLGQAAAEITLDGVVYPALAGGMNIGDIRSLAAEGKPKLLIDGLGNVWGLWCLTEISDTRTFFMDNGQPRKLEFAIKLKSYGDDSDSRHDQEPDAEDAQGADASLSEQAALDSLDEATQALPEITSELSPEKLTAALDAVAGVAGRAVGMAADAARDATAAVNEALAGIKDTVLAAIPASAMQAVRDIQSSLADVADTAYTASIARLEGAVRSLSALRAVDAAIDARQAVAGLDAVVKLAGFGANAAARVLRDTERTCSAVADIGDGQAGVVRRDVAATAGQVAEAAERFTALCGKVGDCTGKVLEKFHV